MHQPQSVNPSLVKGSTMSVHTPHAQNQAIRHGDRRHAASIGRQRKIATATPREQAQAIASIVRKRVADGQPAPDLDRYNLTDATWNELLAILDGDELTAVGDAAGSDDTCDGDDEPGLEEWTATLEEDAELTPSDTILPAPQ